MVRLIQDEYGPPAAPPPVSWADVLRRGLATVPGGGLVANWPEVSPWVSALAGTLGRVGTAAVQAVPEPIRDTAGAAVQRLGELGEGAFTLTGGLRQTAGFEQQGRETAELRRRMDEILARLDAGDRSAMAEGLALERELNAAYAENPYEASERNPDIGSLRLVGGLAQGAPAMLLAPGLEAGLLRNVAAGAIDPAGQAFAGGLQAMGRAAGTLGRLSRPAPTAMGFGDIRPAAVQGAPSDPWYYSALQRAAEKLPDEIAPSAGQTLPRQLVKPARPFKGTPQQAMIDKGLVEPAPGGGYQWPAQYREEKAVPGESVADQVMRVVRSTPGVREEEIKWTGLEEWLKEQTQPVTRQEIADYLKANDVKLEEVVKGSPAPLDWVSSANGSAYTADMRFRIDPTPDGLYRLTRPNGRTDTWSTVADAQRQAQRQIDEQNPTRPKWARPDLVLPGPRSNDREFLLTLPKANPDQTPYEQYRRQLASKYRVNSPSQVPNLLPSEEAELERLRSIPAPPSSQLGPYTSHAYDEPNIVVWLRANDRTGPNGERIFHIEEVQSDWGQKGAKEGFEGSIASAQRAALKKERDELLREWTAIRDNRRTQTGEETMQVGPDGMPEFASFVIEPRELEIRTRVNQIDDLTRPGSGIPDAPLVRKWAELAMRKAIRYASENGYDAISWTRGDQQAERYNALIRNVKTLDYSPDRGELAYKTADGHFHPVQARVEPEQLEAYVGPDAARRLMSAEPAVAVADGSKRYQVNAPPEGFTVRTSMTGKDDVYDGRMIQEANRLGKEFGARVGETSLATREIPPLRVMRAPNGKFQAMDADGSLVGPLHQTEAEARTWIDGYLRSRPALFGQPPLTGGRVTEPVHSLTITPEMRKTATEQGFPLFPLLPTSKGPGSPNPLASALRGGVAGGASSQQEDGLTDEERASRATLGAVGGATMGLAGNRLARALAGETPDLAAIGRRIPPWLQRTLGQGELPMEGVPPASTLPRAPAYGSPEYYRARVDATNQRLASYLDNRPVGSTFTVAPSTSLGRADPDALGTWQRIDADAGPVWQNTLTNKRRPSNSFREWQAAPLRDTMTPPSSAPSAGAASWISDLLGGETAQAGIVGRKLSREQQARAGQMGMDFEAAVSPMPEPAPLPATSAIPPSNPIAPQLLDASMAAIKKQIDDSTDFGEIVDLTTRLERLEELRFGGAVNVAMPNPEAVQAAQEAGYGIRTGDTPPRPTRPAPRQAGASAKPASPQGPLFDALQGAPAPSVTLPNRLTANAADLAADYKYRGMDRARAWDQFVIDRALRPDMDAKEFYRLFDSTGAGPLPTPRQAAPVEQVAPSPRLPDPESADYGRQVEYFTTPESRIAGMRPGEVAKGTINRTLQGSMGTLYEVRVVPGGDESRATTFRIPAQNVRFVDRTAAPPDAPTIQRAIDAAIERAPGDPATDPTVQALTLLRLSQEQAGGVAPEKAAALQRGQAKVLRRADVRAALKDAGETPTVPPTNPLVQAVAGEPVAPPPAPRQMVKREGGSVAGHFIEFGVQEGDKVYLPGASAHARYGSVDDAANRWEPVTDRDREIYQAWLARGGTGKMVGRAQALASLEKNADSLVAKGRAKMEARAADAADWDAKNAKAAAFVESGQGVKPGTLKVGDVIEWSGDNGRHVVTDVVDDIAYARPAEAIEQGGGSIGKEAEYRLLPPDDARTVLTDQIRTIQAKMKDAQDNAPNPRDYPDSRGGYDQKAFDTASEQYQLEQDYRRAQSEKLATRRNELQGQGNPLTAALAGESPATEFDRQWVETTRAELQQEVTRNVARLTQERGRLASLLERDPSNPGNGQIRDAIKAADEQIAAEQARLSAPIKRPSEFMSPAQLKSYTEEAAQSEAAPAGGNPLESALRGETAPAPSGPVVRFEAGKKLTPDERKSVLRSVVDAYRPGGSKTLKGYDNSGDPIYGWEYRPDLFVKSDITGRPTRYYITLPNGKKAHPSELFPNLSRTDVENAVLDEQSRAKNEVVYAKAAEEGRQKRIVQADSKDAKSLANQSFQQSGRPIVHSYFAEDDAGHLVRVDGTDPDDMAYYAEKGYQPTTAPIKPDQAMSSANAKARMVIDARLRDKHPVPPDVLAQYPDLVKKYGPQPAATSTVPLEKALAGEPTAAPSFAKGSVFSGGKWYMSQAQADHAAAKNATLAATTAPRKLATDLRKAADSLQSQIEAKRDPDSAHQNPTMRRSNIIAGMAQDADRLERVQVALKALADAHDGGEVPESLAGIGNRAQLQEIVTSRQYPEPGLHTTTLEPVLAATKGKKGTADARRIIDRAMNRVEPGDHYLKLYGDDEVNAAETLAKIAQDAGNTYARYVLDSIAPYKRLRAAGITTRQQFDAAKSAIEQMATPPSRMTSTARQIKDLERNLIGTKLPGYFPTPKPVVDRMLEEADIQPGMNVLEPSAGKGNIADAVRAGEPDVKLTTIEPSGNLRQILQLKGHNLTEDSDFLRHQGSYDRIVMNPPFETLQDIDHVRHAYDLLKPGGRVVAIMSEGPFFRNDKKATAFRDWLDDMGGTAEKLPEGAFKSSERPTGVATRLVVIDKEAP